MKESPLDTMDFSSVPAHLDPPNWNQKQLQPGQLPSVAVDIHHQEHQLPPVWPLMAPPLGTATATSVSGTSVLPGSATSGVGSSSSVRPGSMAERARMAKIPQPERGLKCPRCDSTNTKFCYFNNYSLSQPRHFCKACRRYWTSGGALRSVPVGGVCHRNKRKNSSKKSSSSSSAAAASALATSASATSLPADAVMAPPQLQPPFGSLHHHLWCDRYSTIGASRLGFPGLSSSLQPAVEYQLGDGLGLGVERWCDLPPTTQQFPFLSPAEAVPPPPPSCPSLMSSSGCTCNPSDDAEAGNVVAEAASLAGQMPASANVAGSGGLITQMASVKMDVNPPSAATSSPREFLGRRGSLQFCGRGGFDAGGYGGNGAGGGAAPGVVWSDLSAFNSPPPGNIQ